MSHSSSEVLEAIASLEIGIVPPSIMQESSEAFKGMSEEEQRIAKRKFRKIKRKLAPVSKLTGKKMTSNVTLYQIRRYLLDKASQMSTKFNN